jgi:glycosyltransferase involved in cell wall biosynthesis
MALQAGLLTKLLRAEGHSVTLFATNFSFPPLIRPLEQVPGFRTLIRFAATWIKLQHQMRRVEVAHVFAASWLYFFVVVWPAVVVGRMCGKTVVLNYRGGEARDFFKRYGWAIRHIFRAAPVVTAPSDFLGEAIREHFHVPFRKVPNILDLSTFRYRQRSNFSLKILVTRHLEKIYDIESALRAYRKLQEVPREASLWIAGTGTEEQYLRRLVLEWNLKNVRFLGYVPHKDLPSLYDQCDILLNASRVDNFPAALLEASAAGLLVVSTCAGGIPFIYENGKTAFLVAPGDWSGLSSALEQAARSPSLAMEMTKNARQLACACDWKEVRKALYEAYGFGGAIHR